MGEPRNRKHNPRVKLSLGLTTTVFLSSFLTGCFTSSGYFGVPTETWYTLTDEQQMQVIDSYYEAKDRENELRAERAALAHERERQRQSTVQIVTVEDRVYKPPAIHYSRAHHDARVLNVSFNKAAFRVHGHRYIPVSNQLIIEHGQTKTIVLRPAHAGRSNRHIEVCYDRGQLFVGGRRSSSAVCYNYDHRWLSRHGNRYEHQYYRGRNGLEVSYQLNVKRSKDKYHLQKLDSRW